MTGPPLLKNPNRVPWISQVDRPIGTAGLSGPVVSIEQGALTTMAAKTLDKDGTYKDADGNFFVGRKGDAKPDGWNYHGPMEGMDPNAEEPATAAPETRMEGGAPENRAFVGAKVK